MAPSVRNSRLRRAVSSVSSSLFHAQIISLFMQVSEPRIRLDEILVRADVLARNTVSRCWSASCSPFSRGYTMLSQRAMPNLWSRTCAIIDADSAATKREVKLQMSSVADRLSIFFHPISLRRYVLLVHLRSPALRCRLTTVVST